MTMIQERSLNKSALIYCRVSTKNQQDEGTSLDTQAEACIRQAELLGYTVGHITKEVYSGADLFDRPLLSRDRVDLRAGKFQALICYAIDRLSRDIAHLAIIADECDRVGAELIFITEQLDQSPEGKLLQSVRGYVAEVERQKIRERTLRGKHARVASGKLPNHGGELFGYRRDKANGVRQIHEQEAEIIQRAFRLYVNERKSLTWIARQFNAEGLPCPGTTREWSNGRHPFWAAATVGRLLRTSAYKGETVMWRFTTKRKNGKRRVLIRERKENIKLPECATPAIISPNVWEQAQVLLKENNTQAGQATRNEKRPCLLRGLIFCGYCGRPMYYGKGQRWGKARYRCQTNGHTAFIEDKCTGELRSTTIESADNWVWEQVKKVMKDPDIIRREIERQISEGPDPNLIADLDSCERQLSLIEKGQQRLVKQLVNASSDLAEIIERELIATDKKKQKLLRDVERLKSSLLARQMKSDSLKSLSDNCELVYKKLINFSFNEKRMLVEALGVRVSARGNDYRLDMSIPVTEQAMAVGAVSLQTF